MDLSPHPAKRHKRRGSGSSSRGDRVPIAAVVAGNRLRDAVLEIAGVECFSAVMEVLSSPKNTSRATGRVKPALELGHSPSSSQVHPLRGSVGKDAAGAAAPERQVPLDLMVAGDCALASPSFFAERPRTATSESVQGTGALSFAAAQTRVSLSWLHFHSKCEPFRSPMRQRAGTRAMSAAAQVAVTPRAEHVVKLNEPALDGCALLACARSLPASRCTSLEATVAVARTAPTAALAACVGTHSLLRVLPECPRLRAVHLRFVSAEPASLASGHVCVQAEHAASQILSVRPLHTCVTLRRVPPLSVEPRVLCFAHCASLCCVPARSLRCCPARLH